MERRITRKAFGWAIGPVLGRLERRKLQKMMKIVPRRYLRPVMRRVRGYRARKYRRQDEHFAERGA